MFVLTAANRGVEIMLPAMSQTISATAWKAVKVALVF